MDIFAHGLWTAAAARAINLRIKKSGKSTIKPLNVWHATFWGIFPDLFAFTVPFFVIAFNILSGSMAITQIPPPGTTPTVILEQRIPIISLANQLYGISHSLIVFAVVFLLAWLIFRRPIWELGGWLFHVLIDIPTHAAQFFPTPLFWPINSWKFLYGFSWGVPWFMALNYSALVVAYLVLWRKEKSND
jgi:membrane-bound metal-dependent hydrolase YbcI (DUF457 family)